jgi:hypothetical protein
MATADSRSQRLYRWSWGIGAIIMGAALLSGAVFCVIRDPGTSLAYLPLILLAELVSVPPLGLFVVPRLFCPAVAAAVVLLWLGRRHQRWWLVVGGWMVLAACWIFVSVRVLCNPWI